MELSVTEIKQRIYSVRGLQIVLDTDLAAFYQTKTKALNQAVRRNTDRFPVDFMFQLTQQEFAELPSRPVTGNTENRGGRRNLSYGFTQEGVSMLSGVLNSDRAVQVNILIMRAFVQLRQVSEAHLDLAQRFDQLEKRCNEQFRTILEVAQHPLSLPSYQTNSVLVSYYEPKIQVAKCNIDQALEPASRDTKSLLNSSKDERLMVAKTHRSKVDAIQQAVIKYFGLKILDLKSSSRIRTVVVPRQIAIYLIREHTCIGFKEIGKIFGKDHSTILVAYRKIALISKTDEIIRDAIQAIELLH